MKIKLIEMKALISNRKIKIIFFLFCTLFLGLTFFTSIASAQTKIQNEKFDDFIYEFTHDSAFQFSRVTFPLTFISWDYEKDKECVFSLKKEQYQFQRLHFGLEYMGSDAYTVFYDNFDCKFRDTGEMVLRWRGFTDMDDRCYFKRMDGKWYLVKMLNYDYPCD